MSRGGEFPPSSPRGYFSPATCESGLVSSGSLRSPPIRALAQRSVGGGGLADDLRNVQRRELAAALEDAAVDHHGINVSGLRRGHEHVCRIGENAKIDV